MTFLEYFRLSLDEYKALWSTYLNREDRLDYINGAMSWPDTEDHLALEYSMDSIHMDSTSITLHALFEIFMEEAAPQNSTLVLKFMEVQRLLSMFTYECTAGLISNAGEMRNSLHVLLEDACPSSERGQSAWFDLNMSIELIWNDTLEERREIEPCEDDDGSDQP